MYKNYGDVNFFENGILIEDEVENNVFSMLVCRPYTDREDLYMFAHITVDISDPWINWEYVQKVCGPAVTPVEKAIAAYEYYGAEEFGAYQNYGYDWTHMTRKNIRHELEHYTITDDVCIE